MREPRARHNVYSASTRLFHCPVESDEHNRIIVDGVADEYLVEKL